jgi:hypothetical protein
LRMSILKKLLVRKTPAPKPDESSSAPTAGNTLEQMHSLCFHLEFEHHGDPDESCWDPSCHAANNVFLEALPEEAACLEDFATVPYSEAELEKFLKEASFHGPETVRKVIR